MAEANQSAIEAMRVRQAHFVFIFETLVVCKNVTMLLMLSRFAFIYPFCRCFSRLGLRMAQTASEGHRINRILNRFDASHLCICRDELVTLVVCHSKVRWCLCFGRASTKGEVLSIRFISSSFFQRLNTAKSCLRVWRKNATKFNWTTERNEFLVMQRLLFYFRIENHVFFLACAHRKQRDSNRILRKHCWRGRAKKRRKVLRLHFGAKS